MNVRKLSIVGLIAGLLGLGVLAVLGAAWAGAVYLTLLGVFAVAHAVLLCSRCENDCCALNPTSNDFLFGGRRARREYHEPANNHWVPLAFVVTLPFGLWGAWRFHPLGLAACLAVVALSFAGYRRASCRYCPHACPLAPRKA